MNNSGVADNRTPYKLRVKRSRRWKAGVALMVLGAVMALVHALEHAGALKLTTTGLDDLFFGWPAAAVIVVIGAVVMGTT